MIQAKLKSVLIVAFLKSLASFLVCSLLLPPGINVFLQLPVLVVLTACYCSLNLLDAAVTSLLGLIVLALCILSSALPLAPGNCLASFSCNLTIVPCYHQILEPFQFFREHEAGVTDKFRSWFARHSFKKATNRLLKRS
ncbi:hypothetical protein Tph_c19710 [Thermacetogenium phaeum DSM 12270]|uniref:Uncharacterized protein n=1 Tax=Thermacetogenium phaeum (strain ATCC BAA-254 / DSM 26808 / PB) TaxID=1089553 RepID=K4LJN2_THEPS|nr:hypothetical protein Tph_c19710 [Thermacetogenium phaeum DSM 12270]MDK2881165.1 hypothetical protein [Clostridia bacterium]